LEDDQPSQSGHYDPSGQWIVYQTGVPWANQDDIWMVYRDGITRIPLTEGPDWDVDPSWSPDGHTIVFERRSDGNLWVATGLFNYPASVGTLDPHNAMAQLLVAPNPARAGTTVLLEAPSDDQSLLDRLEVFDLAGRRISGGHELKAGLASSKMGWSVPSISPGMYILRLTTLSGGSLTGKILVAR